MDGAEQLKSLGEITRLRIFSLLMQSEMCVCEMETILDISQSNISRHLQKLMAAGILDRYRDGQWIHYRLKEQFIQQHPSLPQAVEELIAYEDIYRKDKERLQTYRYFGFSCQDLKYRRDTVMDQLDHYGKDIK